MEVSIPRPEPIRDGDYRTFVTQGYGRPVAVIHLAEGSALDLNHLTAGDCDRLIKAAAKVKGQILDLEARAAAPHGRRNLYEGTCQLCGKPEDDELHAEPAPEPGPYDKAIQQAEAWQGVPFGDESPAAVTG